MRYRLLVVDVDGTLVGAGGRVAPADAAAVRAAEAAGVRVGLSTGRPPNSCVELLRELALSGPHIFFEGSLVLDPAAAEPLLEHRLDPDAGRAVLDFARAAGVSVELYTRDGHYVSAVTPEVEAHAALLGCAPAVADLAAVLASGHVVKAEFVLASADAVAAARAFEPAVAGRVRLGWASAPQTPHITFVNVVDPAASKGQALRAITARLNLPPAAVVAVGDSANDVPMFEAAGLGIAMGNAPEHVRRAAHAVTGPVEAGGLAAAIHQYVLPLS